MTNKSQRKDHPMDDLWLVSITCLPKLFLTCTLSFFWDTCTPFIYITTSIIYRFTIGHDIVPCYIHRSHQSHTAQTTRHTPHHPLYFWTLFLFGPSCPLTSQHRHTHSLRTQYSVLLLLSLSLSLLHIITTIYINPIQKRKDNLCRRDCDTM